MYYIDLVSYGIAGVILIFFYKKVILPFSKKMLDLKTEDDLDIGENLIMFDDIELIDEKDDRLRDTMKKLRGQIEAKSDGSEDQMRYDILLERVREIASDNSEGVSQILTNLSIDDEEKFK